MKVTMSDGMEQHCSFVRLTTADLEAVWELELKAAAELPGIYITKNKDFLQSCLEERFTVGVMANESLVGVLIISISDGNKGMYADVLGKEFQVGELIAFKEGSYLLPAFRGKGFALELARFSMRLLTAEGISEVFSAVGPDHYQQLNRLTRHYGAVIRNFYNSISSGKLRYMMYYSAHHTYSLENPEPVLAKDHSRQRELFARGFVGTGLEIKENEACIFFQKPENENCPPQL